MQIVADGELVPPSPRARPVPVPRLCDCPPIGLSPGSKPVVHHPSDPPRSVSERARCRPQPLPDEVGSMTALLRRLADELDAGCAAQIATLHPSKRARVSLTLRLI